MNRQAGAIAAAVIISLIVGSVVGSGSTTAILLLFGFAAGILYLVKLHAYTAYMGLFLVFLGFSYSPTGFKFGALELGCLVGAACALLYIWRKGSWHQPAVMTNSSSRLFYLLLCLWVTYLVIHFVYTKMSPYRAEDFSLNNALKSYMAAAGPAAMLWYFLRNPKGIYSGVNPILPLGVLCFAGLMLNLAIRAYHIMIGFSPGEGLDLLSSAVFIPFIGATEGSHTLRTLGTVACVIGAVGLTSLNKPRRGSLPWMLYWILLLGGMGGALVSSGRAAPVFAAIGVIAVLIIRRKKQLLFAAAAAAFFFVIMINFMAPWINQRASPLFQRSVTWVMFADQANNPARGSIDSSSRWRRELFHRALAEWRSDPRIFWFGRSTYSFGIADSVALQVAGGFEGVMQSALRRGTTHNAITDHLIAYGLLGCVLSYAVVLSMLYFLWRLVQDKRVNQEANDLALICLTLATLTFLAGLGGAGGHTMEVIWGIILLVALLHHQERERMLSDVGAKDLASPPLRPSVAGTATTRPDFVRLRSSSPGYGRLR